IVHECAFPDRSAGESGHMCDMYLSKKMDPESLDFLQVHSMFALNRREAEPSLLQRLREGYIIVCSRYAYSGVAYSMSKGTHSLETLAAYDKGHLEPHQVIMLPVRVEEAEK
ncbi:hypothetical protein KIPB_012709, partial [Kipferlia bialata]